MKGSFPGNFPVVRAAPVGGDPLRQENIHVKQTLVTVCAFAMLVCLNGCSNEAEDTYKNYVDSLGRLADAMEAKDEEKAKSALKEAKDLEDKLSKTKVTESQKKRIEDKYKEDFEKAKSRIKTAEQKDPIFALKISLPASK